MARAPSLPVMPATDRLRSALAGRYSIEREVGAGGMATVYLARDTKHDREVALKVLRAEATPGSVPVDSNLTASMNQQDESSGHFLDLATWSRREHFDLFRAFSNPFFSVCVDVDVTVLWEKCRAPGSPSFYVATLFHSLRAANETKAFRMRIRGDRVWVHDHVRASATVLRDDDTFGFAIFDTAPTLEEFGLEGAAALAEAKKVAPLLLPRPGEDDMIYHSSLPWMRFTSFTNALGGKDSVPRVVFGKVGEESGRRLMPVAIEVHHALVDGLDVARYLERFETGVRS